MAQHNARFLVEFMAKLSAELQGGRWRWMSGFAPLCTAGVNRPVIYGTLAKIVRVG